MRAVEEGDLPTTADSSESIATQLAKLWFRLDGLLERFKAHMEIRPERGPPDFDAQVEQLQQLTTMVKELRRRPSHFSNGDEGDSDVKKWIVGVGVVLSAAYVIGGWAISNQVSAQSVKLDDIREHQREQDERIGRLEQYRYDERSRSSVSP